MRSSSFKAGLAIEPDNAHLHYDLGLAYKLKDNLADAVPEFEKVGGRSMLLCPTLPTRWVSSTCNRADIPRQLRA